MLSKKELDEKVVKLLKNDYKNEKTEITRLKNELEYEDYKIIKCAEYQLAGKELPYDIEELNQKRDGLREQINKLEEEKKKGTTLWN